MTFFKKFAKPNIFFTGESLDDSCGKRTGQDHSHFLYHWTNKPLFLNHKIREMYWHINYCIESMYAFCS